MTYRIEPSTGIIYNEETVVERYIQELPDAGAIIHSFNGWDEVKVAFDSSKDTLLHIKKVSKYLTEAAMELLRRATVHDESKLGAVEKPLFDKLTPILAGLEYGSPEYKASLEQLAPALRHHYTVNTHHPEHYPNGVDDMTLFDIMEMFLDWKAASERTAKGDITKSVAINADRFKLSPQLVLILCNTIEHLGWV